MKGTPDGATLQPHAPWKVGKVNVKIFGRGSEQSKDSSHPPLLGTVWGWITETTKNLPSNFRQDIGIRAFHILLAFDLHGSFCAQAATESLPDFSDRYVDRS